MVDAAALDTSIDKQLSEIPHYHYINEDNVLWMMWVRVELYFLRGKDLFYIKCVG